MRRIHGREESMKDHYPSGLLVMCAAHQLPPLSIFLISPFNLQSFTVPKDAYDVTLLTRTIGICTEKGIVVADPTKYVTRPSLGYLVELMSVVQLDEWYILPRSQFQWGK